ncbi:aminotransferase class I/II-fold pyridoxal phosphate-dependent enzyme [Halorientalis litorea]|uniref:aminotransferase class I/II-fold pyridoxal phosphate-dependent enzyme n=1 Tax=Halorientalis litorea TaxID=2931977 RepID=UPI001FF5DDE0|nr:aminotransferase class I/II-fold pyridoxal phosphate-dependent enzyme [Halorientalis litorea]
MNPDAVEALLGEHPATDGATPEADDARVHHGSVDDPDVLDFSANTNPRVPDGAAAVYREAFASARSYPADDYPEYRIAAADFADCDAGDVIPTPGGLAAIRLAVATAVSPGQSVAVPYPSFGEYAREVRLQGGHPAFVPAPDVLDVDPTDHAMVVVCNPNNPTGQSYDADALRAFARRCRAADTALLADEAFLGFTEEPSLAGTDGVVVARSLTKLFGLPGLRAGFAVATGRHRERLDAARRTWSLSAPAAAVGTHSMRQSAFVARTRERVGTERARMAERLAARFEVHPSDAPFLLLDAGTGDAADAALADARSEGIALRDARTFHGLDAHVRVAVRLPEENDRLLAALGV